MYDIGEQNFFDPRPTGGGGVEHPRPMSFFCAIAKSYLKVIYVFNVFLAHDFTCQGALSLLVIYMNK